MWILWTPVAIILCIYVSLQANPCFIECQLRTDLTLDKNVETNYKNEPCYLDRMAARCGLLLLHRFLLQQLCCFLALDFDTSVSWPRSFSDFLGVWWSLAPMSSNSSSISTQSLFCFLSIKSLIDLNLFTILWIICLLGTLSSRNLHQNFFQHFLADLYFTKVPHRDTCCSKVYHTMTEHTAH
jgi:hypothetical protein